MEVFHNSQNINNYIAIVLKLIIQFSNQRLDLLHWLNIKLNIYFIK